ncbi:MAG: sulfatase-like hydrolase/transferase [Lentisphaeria bacterium]|nr:sulfatase-like hydrolase/transferase [Lentisphaeria bacterium]
MQMGVWMKKNTGFTNVSGNGDRENGTLPVKCSAIFLFALVCAILFFISAVLYTGAELAVKYYGKISLHQLFFHLSIPLDQVKHTEFFGKALSAVWMCAAVTAVFFVAMYCVLYPVRNKRCFKSVKQGMLVLSVVVFLASAAFVNEYIPLDDWYMIFARSSLIEENFTAVPPEKVHFPEKRNVILIIAESLEDSFSNSDDVGVDLIPQLSRLKRENLSFGGRVQCDGSGWTVAALTNIFYGMPHLSLHGQFYAQDKNRHKWKIVSIWDYFLHHGYNCEYIQGGHISFSGKDRLFASLPQVKVTAFEQLSQDEVYKRNTMPFSWGVDDEVMFRSLRAECARMADARQPFFIAALTLDTHEPMGYLPPDKEGNHNKIGGERFQLALKRLDDRCAAFVEWVRSQEFGKDTVVIIVGDHLNMVNQLGERWKSYGTSPDAMKKRSAYNCFIGLAKSGSLPERPWATFDLMPTVLHAAGARWEGDRMNLGVSLFGTTPTLMEKYGVKYCDREFLKRSDKYMELVEIR